MNFDDTLKARAELTDKEIQKMKANHKRDLWILPVGAIALVIWVWGLVEFIKFIFNLFV